MATYPDSWSKPVHPAQGVCPNIAGEFENKASDAPGNTSFKLHQKHPLYLSDILTSGTLIKGYKHKWITRVKFSAIDKGQLNAEFYKNEKMIHHKTFTLEKDFTCTEEGLLIESHYDKVYEIGGGGRQITQLFFTKGQDGTLILKMVSKESGLALPLLIPMLFSQKTVSFYRFNRFGQRL